MRGERSIEGVLERIVYSNEETGWSVVRVWIRGRGEVTAVGHLSGAQPGESLKLIGRFVRDKKYGEQFRVESFLTVKPSTFIGLEKYLGSGLVDGLGPTMAKRLVQHFGLDTLEVIEHEPDRLAEVEGIGPVRSQKICEAWREQGEIKEVMIFLQAHGVSPAYAAKIYKRYGKTAAAKVRENPYRMAEEIRGIGFQMADKIARDLGVPVDSKHRARAGVLYTLRQEADRGHVYRPAVDLTSATAELLDIECPPVEAAIGDLLRSGELVRLEESVFLPHLAEAEAKLAERVRTLTAQGRLPGPIDVHRAVLWFEKREKIELAEGQRRALAQALESKVLVLTGGPGTGKTTLVRGVVEILEKKGLEIELAAPTGRAAKRLSEATGRAARTVHRLLEWSPKHGGFTRDEDRPLDADLVIVDEASMLDTVLARHLFAAVRDDARVLLVGDVDQLPSVGPGRVLADLIESGRVAVARLDEIFRQARKSLIVTNAHRIKNGTMPILLPDEKGDFFFIERDAPEAILATVKLLIGERIPKSFGIDADDIQILTPMQRGLLGAASLNAELQALVNPDGEAVPRGGRLLRIGDRVMQVKNNYDLEVWNGDIGRIAAINPLEQHLGVDFEDRRVTYEFSNLDELVLAYACSIHKSQGSEYPAVVIPLHTQHFVLLKRNLLYTAITRGKRLVVVVGSRRALELAVRSESSSRRSTHLARRLRNG